MKKFKLVALLLSLVLLVSACGGAGSGEAGKATDKPAEAGEVPELAKTYKEFEKKHSAKVTFFEQGWTGPEKDLDFVAPEIARLTNFEMLYEPMTVPTGDDYNQKLNLIVAGGDVPDIFFGGQDLYTRTIYEKLGESGKIWELSEIIKDYPNLYNLIEPELKMYSKEGKIYQIPTQTGRGNELLYEAPHGMNVRDDFLKQLGMEYPKTPDEFYTYLKRCKEEIKEVNGQPIIPLVLNENLGGIEAIYQAFLPVVGAHGAAELPFDVKDNYKVKNYLFTDSPELMKAAKFINKLSVEGLLDREVLTLKSAQVGEKVSSGRVAAVTVAWWDMNAYSDNAKQDVPELMYAVTPDLYENEELKEYRDRKWTNWIGSWSSLIVSKKVDEETLRHLLATLDWLTTKDGQILTQVGIEGVSFKYNEQGKYEYLPEFLEKTNDLDWNKAAAYGVGYYCQLVFNMPAFTDLRETPPSLIREDNYKGWENRQHVRDLYDANMDPDKDYYFIAGEVENQKFPPIIDMRREFFAKVIAAKSEEEVETLVKEWAATCKNMGIDEIIAEREAFISNLVIE